MKKALLFVIALFASVMIMPTTYALDGVASVDGVNYENLQEAIDNANGKTVTLLSDVTESVTILEGTTVTLDLGSYTLTNVEGQNTITNNGNLTIKGSGTVDNVSHAKAAVFNDKTGEVILESGTYTRSQETGASAEESGGNSFYTIQNYGNMTIESGVQVLNKGSFSSLLENGFYDGSSMNPGGLVTPTLTINGGLFDGGLNTIKNDDYGVLIINGGTFTNVAQAAVLNWNNTTINGGTFTSDKYAVLNGKLDNVMDTGTLMIKGGTFTAGNGYDVIAKMNGSSVDFVNVSVSGGVFNKSIDGSLLDIDDSKDLLQDANGNYVIANKEANYDKVKELITEANRLDKSKYTDESVRVLEDALSRVDFSKNGLEQADVDKMATDIENAIKGLVEKTEEPIVPEDPDIDEPSQDLPEFPNVNLPDKDVKDEVSNPKTADSISYAYIALLISGLGVGIALKKLA